MKRNLVLISCAITVFVLFFAASQYDSENGKAGATGSPGEMTCNQTNCHTGVDINSQGGDLTVTSDIPNWDYVPGETYNISVTMSQPGRSLFGVGVEALFWDGSNGGTLNAGSDTQIKNANVGGNTRKNVVHVENGGATADGHTFNFTWTAPSSNQGTVTLFVAANAANGNGLKTGDWIYNTSEVITSTFVGTEESSEIRPMTMSYNAVSAELTLDLNLGRSSALDARIYTLDGREVMNLMRDQEVVGTTSQRFSLAELQTGTYIVVLKGEGLNSIVEKIIR